MIALVQRVKKTTVSIESKIFSQINTGLCIYLGIHKDDTTKDIENLVKMISKARIFAEGEEKFSSSASDLRSEIEILLIPQFTLYGKIKSGTRPSFTDAMNPKDAKEYFEKTAEKFREHGYKVKTGKFGAFMFIDSINIGPVNFIFNTSNI